MSGGRQSPELRVVVVTYSPGAALDAFLASLSRATSLSFETVLADNGSVDGAPERAAREHPGVVLQDMGGNLGYGRAANAGAAGFAGSWLLVTNPDLTVEPGALDLLVEAAREWPQAGAFGPAILTPDGDLYPSARALPSLGPGLGHALLGWWWPSNRWTVQYRREDAPVEEGVCGWLSGAFVLLRREAFEAVGGFDPRYFMYFEDVDLCDRLARAGHPCVYVPTAVVHHEGGRSTSRSAGRMAREHHVSAYRYLAGRYPGWRWAPLRLMLRVGLAVRVRVASRAGVVGGGAVLGRRRRLTLGGTGSAASAGLDRPAGTAERRRTS